MCSNIVALKNLISVRPSFHTPTYYTLTFYEMICMYVVQLFKLITSVQDKRSTIRMTMTPTSGAEFHREQLTRVRESAQNHLFRTAHNNSLKYERFRLTSHTVACYYIWGE